MRLAATNSPPTTYQPLTGRLVTLLLALTIFYIPNQSHFPDFSITGLNITNILLLSLIAAILIRENKISAKAPLKTIIVLFFATLIWGFLIGQINDNSRTGEDLQALKNAISYILLYFIAFHAVQDARTIRILFFVLLATIFFDIYLGLRQALDYGLSTYNESRRVAAPFSWNSTDSNRTAAFLCIYLMPMAATAFYYRDSRWIRLFALFALALGVFVDFFTYSRQSYGILAGLFLLFFFRKNKILAIAVLIAILNYSAWLPDAAISRIDMTVQSGDDVSGVVRQPKELDESTESRFIIWAGAVDMMKDFPLGVGLNHFSRTIGNYAPAFKGYDAHNFYVLSAAENGITAPIVALIILIGLYRIGRSLEKSGLSSDAKVYGVALSMAAIAAILVNLYGSRFLDGNVMSNFWILAGLTARYSMLAANTRKRQPESGEGRNPAPSKRRNSVELGLR